MYLFAIILGVIGTLIGYNYFPYPLVLTIGGGWIIGFILTSIYVEIESNFYVQTIFIILNSLVSAFLVYQIDDQTLRLTIWIIYTIWIFTWCRSWLDHFANYIYDKYFERELYDHKYRNELIIEDFRGKLEIREKIQFTIFASPYLIVNAAVVMLWNTYPWSAFASPAVLTILSLLFLLIMKIKGVEISSGFCQEIGSIGDFFRSIGNYFIHFFGGIYYFIRKWLFRLKCFFTGGRSGEMRFSFLLLLFAMLFLAASLGITYLETKHIYSDFCNNIIDNTGWLFDLTKWFPMTQFMWNDVVTQIHADDLIALFLFIPKLIIFIGGLLLAVGAELLLTVAWLVLCGIFALLVSIAGLGLAFLITPIISLILLVIFILTITRNRSPFNRFIALVCFLVSIASCYYFFTLFPIQ